MAGVRSEHRREGIGAGVGNGRVEEEPHISLLVLGGWEECVLTHPVNIQSTVVWKRAAKRVLNTLPTITYNVLYIPGPYGGR